ncbi:MAG: carboxypeptidase regulatory-like domain-containing protein, partial [Acidobacteria bacterium]|nr:carboxypeptidase regulatory-like domain-containing protein [Acidobacteriota bacterium]
MRQFVLAFAVTALAMVGQTTSTSILGTVSDASGGIVAGAKVIVTNTGTAVRNESVTTSSGDFLFPLLEIGQYDVSVEA